ncbi:alpha/beta-type small acid-soluble spore protein [Effusibacillus lacus]|uniref:Alpha/beta hydrolase n=1 Tax=Effusibacillus lacus TaxID=1348429 RepID=A0A292YI27_9BACL|nr:alpha/beta-type small acid-soluble spore protein [Effusibacillus lacus]TCS68759.1 small acid-soluble spore protein alpha/beta type [Effusibacillus lacus]GAX90677.1 alpha/beta hydrolase [Effusibacillus lacus]
MPRRNRLLVPEARTALDRFKCEVMQDLAPSPNVSCTANPNDIKFTAADRVGVPLVKGDNGELTARQAGKVGGQLGGSMVKRMVEMAQQQLANQNQK